MTDSAIDAPASSRLRTLWARVRGRPGDERRDACGEPWMLGFGVADAEASDPVPELEAPGRPEAQDPHRFRVLVGRDADDRDADDHEAGPAPGAFLDEPERPARSLAAAVDAVGDTRTLVDALHRVADSFERVADSIDADRRARRATLDDVDSLLRALVGELRSPAAVAPVVLAGTIDGVGVVPSSSAGDGTIDLAAVDAAGADRRPFERARRA